MQGLWRHGLRLAGGATRADSTLKVRYKAVDSWDDVEVIFEGPDKATWKDLTLLKNDPDDDEAVTKLVRAK